MKNLIIGILALIASLIIYFLTVREGTFSIVFWLFPIAGAAFVLAGIIQLKKERED